MMSKLQKISTYIMGLWIVILVLWLFFGWAIVPESIARLAISVKLFAISMGLSLVNMCIMLDMSFIIKDLIRMYRRPKQNDQ
jgi:hypothetical protein